MRTLHLHLKGVTIRMRGRAVDAVHDDPTDDLVARLRAALSRQGVTTHDDAEQGEGHWVTMHGTHVFVNGAGDITKGPAKFVGTNISEHGEHAKLPQPTGGMKAKVHAMLSAGHAFTFQELHEVLGKPPEKALTNALAELKNPKWAGSKGALDIVKGPDGKFQVKPKAAEAVTVEPVAPQAPPIAPVAPAPSVAPVEAPDDLQAKAKHSMAHGEDPDGAFDPNANDPNFDPFEGAPPEPPKPLTKEQADAAYKYQLQLALGKIGEFANSDNAALTFKNAKAEAMAEWAGHVKGGKHEPKKVTEVFKADQKLVEAVQVELLDKGSISPEKADELLEQWKQNTKLEKQGLLNKPAEPKHDPATQAPPSKVAPPQQPPPPVAASAPAAAETPHFPKVTSYVPDDHVGITSTDIGSGSEFDKGIKQLKAKLTTESSSAQHNKATIADRLKDRLKDSAAFQHMRELTDGKEGQSSLESQLIACWAGSSGGQNPTSNAAQLAIRDAFGMQHEDVSYDALKVVKQHKGDEDKVFGSSLEHNGIKDTPANRKVWRAALHDFALAQYANTQDKFKEMGITHLHLARGMSVSGVQKPGEVDLKLQPASSFSTNWDTAKGFSGGDGLYYVKVPVEQVLGSYLTGYGCTNEHEVVVLAHPKTAAVEQPAGQVSSLTSAMEHLDKHLPGSTNKKAALADPGQAPSPPHPDMLSFIGHKAVQATQELHAKGDLKGLEEKLTGLDPQSMIGSYVLKMKEHLAASQAYEAAPKPPSPSKVPGKGKFKPAAAPKKPGGAKSQYAALAYKAAKEGDFNAAMVHVAMIPGNKPASTAYGKKLVEHIMAQKQAELEHNAAAAALKAQPKPKKAAMHGTTPLKPQATATPAPEHKVVGYQPGVPSHHLSHPHYDPVAYANWQAQGKTEQQIGKTLAAIKFAHNKKQQAAAGLT